MCTSVTTGKKLIKGAKKLGYSTKKRDGRSAQHFTFYEEDTGLKGGKKAAKVLLPFSNYSTVRLRYDKKKKKYMKYEYGKKHMDTYYKKQLSFKNVIIQLVNERNIDRNGYQTMTLSGTGKGYYITNGKRVPITWKRKEGSNTMVYRDKDGGTLTVNPGKTYIAETEEVMELAAKLKKQKLTVIWIEHILKVMKNSTDRLMCIAEGRNVVCGSPEEVIGSDIVEEIYLGTKE